MDSHTHLKLIALVLLTSIGGAELAHEALPTHLEVERAAGNMSVRMANIVVTTTSANSISVIRPM